MVRKKVNNEDVNIVNRKELLKILDLTKASLSKDTFMPIMTHFCFTGEKIYSFNGIQHTSIDYKTPIKGAVSGNLLINLLRSYNNKEFAVKNNDDEIVFKHKKSKFSLSCLPESDFVLKNPDLPDEDLFNITEDFINGLVKCLTTINQNLSLENQNGITLEVVGRSRYLYSTNTECISRYRLKDIKTKGEFNIMLPKEFCEQLVLLFREFGVGKFYLYEDNICVVWDTAFLSSKFKKDIVLCSFKTVIDKTLGDDQYILQDIPEDMKDIFKRSLMLLESDNGKVVWVNIKDKDISFTTKAGQGVVEDHFKFSESCGNFVGGYDSQVLNKVFDNIKTIGFIDKGNHLIIIGKDDNYLLLISSFRKNHES